MKRKQDLKAFRDRKSHTPFTTGPESAIQDPLIIAYLKRCPFPFGIKLRARTDT